MQVEEFTYNGFMVNTPKNPKIMPYTAEFKSWTNDPGIALCSCSDGQDRLIPTCCLIGELNYPKQDFSNKVYFGEPSKS